MITHCNKPGMFSLTFDDGITEYTNTMLDILKFKNIQATFFLIGINSNYSEAQRIILRAYNEGHQIASHTTTHPYLSLLSKEDIINEINLTENIIEKAINKRVRYIRNPYLDSNDYVDSILKWLDYVQVGVNLDTNDWKYRDTEPEKIIEIVKSAINNSNPFINSFISLQHDTTPPSIARVSDIIDIIKNGGYHLVTVEECLGLGPAYRN